jgi:hypothetical protein
MVFPREFPSGWKTTESSGKKIVVNCSQKIIVFEAQQRLMDLALPAKVDEHLSLLQCGLRVWEKPEG